MRFVIAPEKLHFFAHDTGKRIAAGAPVAVHAPSSEAVS
jgi:sn-glycerol 3-phosphate transport system ATP-binding protein